MINSEIFNILDEVQAGVSATYMALEELEDLNVHGAFTDDLEFIGYDYSAQRWIDTRSE